MATEDQSTAIFPVAFEHTLNHYRIVAKLGAGGMGEVYLAEDSRLRRKVALKLLPASIAQEQGRLRRFEQEALAASALNHPHILTIYEFGTISTEAGATHYLASEFIDGETLRARLQSAPLLLPVAVEIAVQTAQALVAAHEAGIIHRDIKPENVMIRKDGIVKVLDFGLAKLTGLRNADFGLRNEEDAATLVQSPTDNPQSPIRIPQSTLPGTVMGTVAYMSPEQARGKPVDARTDLFSLGVMLYEMLARRQPFTGETINHVIIAILEQEPPPLPPEVPIELAQILKQALAKNADERTPSARVLLADLKKLQKRLEFDAERARDLSPSEAEAEPAEAPTLLLKPTTAAAPEALTTAAGSRQSTSSNLTPIKPKHWLMMAVSLLVLGGGFFGYRAFAPNGKQIESIAVLPFVNASGNAEAEYLSDGMTETLISSLSQLPKLSVKARSSVFRYKGKETNPQTIGQELKVQAILNGRVVQRDDQLTLTLELVEVQTENVLWSEQYNRKQTDLVALQSEIARDVSSKLKSKLSGAEEAVLAKSYTANPEAYQLYLKGRFQWNKRTGESLRKAIEFFHQAIEQDPRYALAYAGLADAFMVLHFHGGVAPAESYGKAKTAARQALALDETLAEAHTALAYVLFRYDWKADDAFREFQRAIELNPNYPTAHHWYGESLTLAGRFDDGIAALRRAQELDPLSLVINTDIGNACYYARRYDAAIEQLHKTLELDQNFAYAYFNLGLAHTMKGQYAEALTAFRRAQQLNDGPHLLANLAYCYAASGQRAEAVQLVKQMHEIAAQRYVSAYSFAVAYAGLGERDQALQWLEKSYQDHSSDVTYVKTEPRFDNLRADPRFGDLLRRIGLSQ